MGDFWNPEGFASTTHETRGRVAKTPYFPKITCCLAIIMGETCDSGHNLCLDGSGKNRNFPERFSGERMRAPRSEIRA
jgi:hypothetical protein